MVKVSRYKKVGLDTNIFVYYLQKHPQFGPTVRDIFQSLSKSKAEVITSVISLTEILSVKATTPFISLLQHEFLSIPFLNIIPVNNEIAIEAARLRRNSNFSLPDSIQLATALQAKAKAFITNDDRLKKFKELKIILLSGIKK